MFVYRGVHFKCGYVCVSKEACLYVCVCLACGFMPVYVGPAGEKADTVLLESDSAGLHLGRGGHHYQRAKWGREVREVMERERGRERERGSQKVCPESSSTCPYLNGRYRTCICFLLVYTYNLNVSISEYTMYVC